MGKLAATVTTSSPGRRRTSSRRGEVSAEAASRLAEEPELVKCALRTPTVRASACSNRRAAGPEAILMSSAVSTSAAQSSLSSTAPEDRTGVTPGTNPVSA